jgi:ABC-type branched-subunit amino acid transport system substrate-binding protein
MRRVLPLALALVGCENVLGIDTGRYLVDAAAKPACAGPIRLRVVYDMTGPTRDVGNDTGKGVYDYLRDIDDTGGIRGCRLEVDVQDSKYDTQTTLGVYEAWRARPEWREVSAIFVQGTPMTQLIAPRAADEHKLVVSSSYAGALAAPAFASHDVSVPSLNDAFVEGTVPVTKTSQGYPFVFFQSTDYTTSARIAMSHTWAQGAKRVGFFYCTTSAFCSDPVDGAKTFLEKLGGTRVGRDLAIELAEPDDSVAAKVSAFFQKELAHKTTDPSYDVVDWIWFGDTRAELASLGKALARVKTDLGVAVSVVTNTYALDEALYAACGDGCVGFLGVQAFQAWGDPSATGMQDVMRVHAKYRAIDKEPDNAHRTVDYVAGYVTTAAWRIAATAAIDAGLPMNGANLRAAFERFRNQPVEGFGTISYTDTDHRPQGTARIYRLAAGGKLEAVGQPITITLTPEWIGW